MFVNQRILRNTDYPLPLFIRSNLLALYILYFPLFIPRFKVEKRIDKQIISINKIQQHGSRVLNTVLKTKQKQMKSITPHFT